MYCKHCGAPIADESKFCPNCGRYLPEESPAEETPVVTEEQRGREETYNEITNGIPAEEEIKTEEYGTVENIPEEDPEEPRVPPYAPQEPSFQPPNDPFTGPAHPSVKKNIIIACVAVGVATIISIVLMVVGIVSIAKNGALEETLTTMDAYEEAIPYEDEDNNPAIVPVDLGDAGNTVGNVINGGAAVDDGPGGVYYADLNAIYHRSTGGEITEVTGGKGDSYSNLNLKDNILYYIINSENNKKQEIMSYDLSTKTETNLTTPDEEIHYMMAYGDELYYATEFNLFAIDLATEKIRTVYTAKKPLFDVCVTEKGIYFAQEEESGYFWLYRIGHNGTAETPIEKGYYFCISNGALYTNDLDYTGCDTIFKTTEDGEAREPVYSFEENTYITQMNVQNNILCCVTETMDANGDYTYEVRSIDLESGKESIIDKDFTSEENPFYSPNIGGSWIFYYDMNFDYRLHVYELPL